MSVDNYSNNQSLLSSDNDNSFWKDKTTRTEKNMKIPRIRFSFQFIPQQNNNLAGMYH